MPMDIEVGLTDYRGLNARIHAAIRSGEQAFKLTRVYGQRYIGDALQDPVSIQIHGTPGNDLAAFMDGCKIEVFGNGQDQVANTMNAGEVIIHGRCGDTAGYGMRGGSVFVRDDAGWRCGIHMKEYQQHRPELVIGGNAGAFLGEYMAGGVILLLGEPEKYIANGMHGGVIYLAHPLPDGAVNGQVVQEELEGEDRACVDRLLARYNALFGTRRELTGQFRRLRPRSASLYSGMYT